MAEVKLSHGRAAAARVTGHSATWFTRLPASAVTTAEMCAEICALLPRRHSRLQERRRTQPSPPGWHSALQIAELRLALASLLCPRRSKTIAITDVDVLRMIAEQYLRPRVPTIFSRVHTTLAICGGGTEVAVAPRCGQRACCRTAVFGDCLSAKLEYAEFRLDAPKRTSTSPRVLKIGVVRSDFDPRHDRADERGWLGWQYFLRSQGNAGFQREPIETKANAPITTKWMGAVPVESGDVVGLLLDRTYHDAPLIKAYRNGVYIGAFVLGSRQRPLHRDLCWAVELKKNSVKDSEVGTTKVSVEEFPACQLKERNVLHHQRSTSPAITMSIWSRAQQLTPAYTCVGIMGWALSAVAALLLRSS